ncbi:MAG: EscU/YscU/HrcU family type III secretion system export apparatus switch protein, partial [Alphaproteobacteria bacterium]
MAGDTDDAQKTEEPTPRKLEEARKKGQVANSREVNHWFLILAGAVAFMSFVPGMARDIVVAMSRFVTEPDLILADRIGMGQALSGLVGDVLMAMLPFMGVLMLAAMLAGVVQSGFLISFERIKPELSKVSILKGFKRLFSLKSVTEFLKSLFKLVIVGSVVAAILSPVFDNLPQLMTLDTTDVMTVLLSLAVRLFIGVLSIMTVITIIDVLYQKFEHIKGQRMSRQEIKDEMKQTEGDPQVKARLRQIRTERARRRMMASVPEADVVITNPT